MLAYIVHVKSVQKVTLNNKFEQFGKMLDIRAFAFSRPILPTKITKKLDLHIGELMQICIHRKDNSPKPVNHRLTLKEGPKVKSDHTRRFPAHDFL